LSHPHDVHGVQAAIAVLTISDTRTEPDDRSGRRARELLANGGHRVLDYRLLPDDPDPVAHTVHEWLGRDDCDGVITNGGTGISPRDRTHEALRGLIDQPLPGFGELFRMLSWEQVGSKAMLSRAFGGVARGKLLFGLPGSTAAVELALERLIVPELGHLLAELRKR
jgi:molybdenum cofactor biosynthesis protein B